MTKRFAPRARFLGAAVAVAALVGVSAQANAGILFQNITNRQIKFVLKCDAARDIWTINPGQSTNIACNDPSAAARVEIHTDHHGTDMVVRGPVFDGNIYQLHYDADGDVNIRHL